MKKRIAALFIAFVSLTVYSVQPFYHTYYLTKPAPEDRIKIAVIDTGIMDDEKDEPWLCRDNSHVDFTGEGITDSILHGTNIAGLIAAKIDYRRYCIMIEKYYVESWLGSGNYRRSIHAFRWAIEHNAKLINYSAGGNIPDAEEKTILAEAIKKHIYVIVAAGNEHQELNCKDKAYYPACYHFRSKYFHSVGNYVDFNNPAPSSNYGPMVTDWEFGQDQCYKGICMSGTSQATANLSGDIIEKDLR